MFRLVASAASNPPLGTDSQQMLVVGLVMDSLIIGVHGLVHSRLDCGNSVLVSLPPYLSRQLQSVLNAAARLVYHVKARDHITDTLISHHRHHLFVQIDNHIDII